MKLLKKNLDVLILEGLYEEIIGGNWIIGQALNPDELAGQFGVSKTPVLQVLKRMNILGMVEISSKGHYSIRVFDEKQVCDLMEIRLVLEQQAIYNIEKSQLEPDFEQLTDICENCLISNEAGDVIQTRRMDLLFHRTLIDQADNKCLTDLYDKVQAQFMVANYLLAKHTPEQQKVAADDHSKILIMLKGKDYSGTRELLAQHIDGACDKILRKMRMNQSNGLA